LGRIPDHILREIRDRVDLVDLVGRHVELKRAGRSHKGLCPFHAEKTPSFNVNPDRQIFHCFGCGAGGDAIGFLMHHDNLTFPEAARVLAREVGVEIPASSGGGERGQTERLLAALEVASRLYREALASSEGKAAREYLERRGLDVEAASRYGVGYAPDRWDAVTRALSRADIPAADGEKVGLLRRGRSGGHYDMLRGRLVFPIQDARGRVVGFGGRALAQGQEPKYLNTTESPVFHKRRALYGLPHALEPMRRASRAVVCEGYFDRIALERAGVGEGVATCGTSLTADHARELRRRTREVVLLFDGDAAGGQATWRALEVLLPEGLRVRRAVLPEGCDPDDVLAADGADALRAVVDGARDALEAAMDEAVADGVGSPAAKADAVARVAPLVAGVVDPVERGEWARRLSVVADARVEAVEAVVRASRKGGDPVRSAREEAAQALPRRETSAAEERQLRLLAVVLFHHPELVGSELPERLDALLPEGSWKSVVNLLCDAALEGCVDESGGVDLHRVEGLLDEEAASRLRRLAFEPAPDPAESSAATVLEDLLSWFARRRRQAEGRDLTRRLRDPSADAATLLAEKQRQLEARRALYRVDREGSG